MKARTATRIATPGDNALKEDAAPRNTGRRPIEKARRRFPGAGSEILAIMKIYR
jgi:hypothetical protein